MFKSPYKRSIFVFVSILLLLPNLASALTLKEIIQGYDDSNPKVLGATTINVVTTSDAVANGVAFQTAINAAQCGDTIVLTAGSTYSTNDTDYGFELKAKNCNGQYITVQSSRMDQLAEGRRVTIADAQYMPKLVNSTGYPVVTTARNASYYKFLGIEVTKSDTRVFSEAALVTLGNYYDKFHYETERATSNHHFIFDRVYVHGLEDGTDEYIASSRMGFVVDANNVDISNSRVAGFRAIYPNTSIAVGSTAIGATGSLGADDVNITNNYLESWFSVIFLGGGAGWSPNNALISNSSVSNGVYTSTFSRTPNLDVGDIIAINIGQYHPINSNLETWKTAKVTQINGTTVSYVPYSGVEYSSSPDALSAIPAASSEVQWDGYMPTRWKIERNTIEKNKNVVIKVGQLFREFGKGQIETKGCQDCIINGNVFSGGGVSFTITVRNQGGGTPWFNLNNLLYTNNWIRSDAFMNEFGGSAVFGTLFEDNIHPTVVTKNVHIANNLIETSGPPWIMLMGGSGIHIYHNTVLNTQQPYPGINAASVLVYSNTRPNSFRDNIYYNRDSYGTACFAPALNSYALSGCWDKMDNKNIRIRTAESASKEALQNLFPTDFIVESASEIGFTNPSAVNYKLLPSSIYKGQGSDGTDPGVNMDQLLLAVGGNYTPPVPTPVPTVSPTPTPTITPTPTPIPTVDTTAPVISAITTSSITTTTATISWTTNEASDSQIEYGLSSSYGVLSPIDSTLSINHTVNFSNLTPGVTYYYRVKSKDASGNVAISAGQSFVTTGSSVTPTPTPTVTPTPANPPAGGTGNWYSSSWLNKKTITINKAQVQGTQTNFPVLISLTDPELKSTSNSGKVASAQGNDLVFTTSSNTKLSHEIEKYDPVTGQLIAWVKVPSISSANDTTLNLYFGNSSVASQQDAVNVWDSSYKGVWHLKDATNLNLNDSTNNAGNGTNSGATSTGSPIGGAAAFSGTGQYFTSADSDRYSFGNGTTDNPFTLSAWAKPTDVSSGGSIIDKYVATGNGEYIFGFANNNLYGWVSDDSATAYRGRIVSGVNSLISNNSWAYVNMVYDGGGLNSSVKLYVNGTQKDTTDFTTGNYVAMENGVRDFSVGRSNGGLGGTFSGAIDEVRVISGVKTSDYIKTEYNNQSNPSSFISVSSASAYTPPATPTPTPTPTPTNTTPTPTPTPVVPTIPVVTFQNKPETTTPTTIQTFSNTTNTTNALRLINNNGTFYLIKDGKRQGITNPGMLFSYGFTFSQAKPATAADNALPEGSLLLPSDGALVKSKEDQTVYLVSNGKRHGFVSEQVFKTLGYKFSSVLIVTNPELQLLPKADNLFDITKPHLPGTDININGTIYYIGSDSKLYGYPTLAIYNSWHIPGDISKIVTANSADKLLLMGTNVEMRVVE